jgi:hypothetical protein
MSPSFLARVNAVGAFVLRFALAGFAQIVCVNDEIRRALARLGVPEDKLSVVPAFLGAAPQPLEDGDEQRLRHFQPLLSVVAGSGPEYGLPVLMEALQRLRHHYPEIGCIVLGTNGAGKPSEMVRALGLSEHVRFLGPLPHQRCVALLARSDVCVRPSLADGDAVSVREALSLAVPVVASDVTCRPPGTTLFLTGDSGDLAEKVLMLLRADRCSGETTPPLDFFDAILSVYRKATGGPRVHIGFTESARWLWPSLCREIMGFRVNYPIEIVPGAGQARSLRYYIYSDKLFLDDQKLDAQGVPLKQYRLLGLQYNPLFVAWWGLYHLERAAREHDDRHLNVFLTQVNWLKSNAVVRRDGTVVWPCYFEWQEGHARLQAPWISAMYQGVVISALVRGFRLTREKKLLDLALAGSRVFSLDVGSGGVRTYEQGQVLYEEYPAFPLPRVLDGFLFALLGLYDLSVETEDPRITRLFAQGVDGLKHTLRYWDYRGKWSWYGSHGYLCPPHYHGLNRSLLQALGRLSREPVLTRYAETWDPARLSLSDKLEVYTVFVLTKNLARVRFRAAAR